MFSILTICCCMVSTGDVTVRPLQGDPVQGALIELTDKSVTLQTADGNQTFKGSALHQVKMSAAELGAEAAKGIFVELVDDSLFPASQFTLAQGKASIQSLDGKQSAVPARLVRSIRFHKQDESVKKQWAEIAGTDHVGDVVVVRKVSQGESATQKVVLDQLEGAVHEVGESLVVFEFDGERIEVPRSKLEGIVFRVQAAQGLADAACRLKDTSGGVWNLRSLSWQNDHLQLTTVAGAEIQIPAGRLLEVDYSASNLVFLSDLEPESIEWRPYFQSPATPASLTKWFQAKRDQGIDGLPLSLSGVTYEKGLALHSRSLVSYRLTKRYRRFVATVGIENRFRSTANLVLVVFGDDRELFTRAIKGTEEAFELDLDIQNVRRLKILVDFGDDRSDAGDLLYLCNARLVK